MKNNGTESFEPPEGWKVRVRMYRQGLGDCFLLKFKGEPEPFYMLIDCGVLNGTKDPDDKMQRVARNIHKEIQCERKDGQAKLDVLIGTHGHWDHLSGFLQAKQIFDEIQVDKVWLAWTEDPDNWLAQKLKKHRSEQLLALKNALNNFHGMKGSTLKELEHMFGFFSLKDKKTTEDAFNYVAGKVESEHRRYLEPGEAPIILRGLPEVRVYVLGPPQDEDKIRRSKPSKKHSEVYQFNPKAANRTALSKDLQPDLENHNNKTGVCPFEKQYCMSIPEAEQRFKNSYYSRRHAWRKIDGNWFDTCEQIALDLDENTNNTSLALAIEMNRDGKVLLFPGDAQVGNWLSWDTVSWKNDGRHGSSRQVTARDLLKRTALYKVSHHCSHNATLREKGLELMEDEDLVALIPVDEDFLTKYRPTWKMPFGPLYDCLMKKTGGRILRADRSWPNGFGNKPAGLSKTKWDAFYKSTFVDPDNLFIDYYL